MKDGAVEEHDQPLLWIADADGGGNPDHGGVCVRFNMDEIKGALDVAVKKVAAKLQGDLWDEYVAFIRAHQLDQKG